MYLNGINDTKIEYPSEKTIHRLFEEKAALVPQNTALVFNGSRMKYGELNEKANKLAWLLIEKGIKVNENVGLILNRGFDMIVSVLAILKAGAAYVPIDPAYPAERKDYILKNSGVAVVLMQQDLKVDCKTRIVLPEYDLSGFSSENPNVHKSSSELAYVIYTSGSTGLPKGVMIEHHSAVNLINWVNRTFNVGEKDTLLFVTSICFDLSVYDIFGMLAAGGSIVIAEKWQVENPAELISLINQENITFWDSVPTTMNFLVNSIKEKQAQFKNSTLRLVFLSGDWIPVKLPDTIMEFFPNANVISLGGATEGTVWSIYYPIEKVESDWKSIPYGRPIDNNTFYILDDMKNPVPDGETGELYIGGVGVARGYINDPERTLAAFFEDGFIGTGMMYKTGDLGRIMDDGNIEFLGRKDHQVKIRGFRVETGEIENRILTFGNIDEAVVTDRNDASGSKYLCAYIVSKSKINIKGLKNHLSRMLPDYMLPSVIMQLDSLPLNDNGKIDRKALPEPSISTICSDVDYLPPSSDLEKELEEIWGSVLGLENIGTAHDFFEIGGSSVLAVSLAAEMEKKGLTLSVQDINQFRTIKQQSVCILKNQGKAISDKTDSKEGCAIHTAVDCTASSRKKIIDNIQPFNDVFYKNCFYNSLFPVINHFFLSIDAFLANDIGVYFYNRQNCSIKLDAAYISEKTDFEILGDIGISTKARKPGEDLPDCLMEAIGNGKPVILFVDCFFEPFRIDTYKKIHFPHTLLVCGFDEEEKTFDIIEHNHRDLLSYKKRVISFDDILKAHQGYMENFYEDNKGDVFLEFQREDSSAAQSLNYKGILDRNMEKHTTEIFDGLQTLLKFKEDYAILIEKGDEALLKASKEFVRTLNKIMDNRRVERYKILKVVGDENLAVDALSHVISIWDEIRSDIIKFSANTIFKREVFESHIDKISQVYQAELKYHGEFANRFR